AHAGRAHRKTGARTEQQQLHIDGADLALLVVIAVFDAVLVAQAIAAGPARVRAGAGRCVARAAARALGVSIALHALAAVAVRRLGRAAHRAARGRALVSRGVARAALAVRIIDAAHAHRVHGRLAGQAKRRVAAAARAAQAA